MTTDDLFDVTIIGGGTTGLFAAFYAGLRGMRTKLVDSLNELGGQLMALYPEKYVYDVAGFPKVLAKDLGKQLIEQGMQFHPTVCLGERVTALAIGSDKIITVTTDKAVHRSKTVIISVGIGSFKPKTLEVPGVERFLEKGVWYGVKEKERFRGKRIAIVGGGDSAVDWALNLYPLAASTTLIHRRDGFRAHEDSVKQLKASPVTLKLFYEVKAVQGNTQLEAVTLINSKSKAEETLPVDALLINIGFLADPGPLRQWGLQLDGNMIKVNPRMETNLPGVYAAGDGASHEAKLKLIATGFGEAAIAVNFAKTYIDPTAKAFPGHSSEMDWPATERGSGGLR
ncbi:MAG: NAD(P)/FAD-dependent oxidoreductase [Elusimicrobia bacterium]|nr:NAD(P)/FAD-dependent oxidoreductase [Elusimicrobiota bacterium]